MLSYFKEEEDFTLGRSPIQRLNLTGTVYTEGDGEAFHVMNSCIESVGRTGSIPLALTRLFSVSSLTFCLTYSRQNLIQV